jgi:hypothetical protein
MGIARAALVISRIWFLLFVALVIFQFLQPLTQLPQFGDENGLLDSAEALFP